MISNHLGTETGTVKTEPSDQLDGDSGSSDNSNSEDKKTDNPLSDFESR